MKNPTSQLAKEIIANGEIGEVIHFYGTHNEDYMADPSAPIHWHCFKEKAGLGALGDLSAHIINMAQFLVGDIETVCGDMEIVIKQRPEKRDQPLWLRLKMKTKRMPWYVLLVAQWASLKLHESQLAVKWG